MAKTSILNIQIKTGDTRPIFKQVVDGIRMQIIQGHLNTGDKLPSVRGLAMQLTVNVNTIAKAYTVLTTEGVLESRAGLGNFVAEHRQRLSVEEQKKQLSKALEIFINEVASLDFSKEEILADLDNAMRKIEKLNKGAASSIAAPETKKEKGK